ncbi:MAG: response regulator transcription factor [Bacteroidales bacterium]|nr:response regulator transcription factor [Bacteroidales bacterium]
MKLNCAIIDDEYLARQYIIDYIQKLPFLNLIGDYNSPLLVIEEIKNNKIDILFLDIQMPDITGLDFLRSLNPQPYIIITTAYKEYALEGYEHNVIDYLLKPFSFDRFLKAVNKVIDKIQQDTVQPIADKNHKNEEKPRIEDAYMIIRADRKLYKINYDDLIYMEGQRAYVTFHTKERKITALITLRELEDTLPKNLFVRIHKSFIVSVKHIDSLEGNLLEIHGKKLSVGTSYRDRVEKLFRII